MMMKRKSVRYEKRGYIGLVYILPWVAGFGLFQLLPFVKSFQYSFTNMKVSGSADFIGLANYVRAFTADANFPKAVLVTLRHMFYALPAKIIFALFVAMILNQNLRGINLFRTVYYLPSILGGSVAISALWRVLFAADGFINNMLALVGIRGVSWLGSYQYALATISVIDVWQFGSSMVLFLAALKQVPSELYDAASVDGARRVRRFFSITLPMISPILFFNIIMQTINMMQSFTSSFVVTKGGPLKSTYVIAMKLYEDAFSHYNMGYACAESWIMFVGIMLCTVLYFKTSHWWVHYSDGR